MSDPVYKALLELTLKVGQHPDAMFDDAPLNAAFIAASKALAENEPFARQTTAPSARADERCCAYMDRGCMELGCIRKLSLQDLVSTAREHTAYRARNGEATMLWEEVIRRLEAATQ